MARTRTATRTRSQTRNRLIKRHLLEMATRYNSSRWAKYAALIDNLVESRVIIGVTVIAINGEDEIEHKLSYRIDWDEHYRLTLETQRPNLPSDWTGDICPELERGLQLFDVNCEREQLRVRVQFRLQPGADLAALGLVRARKRKWSAAISKRTRTSVIALEETEILYESTGFDE